MKGVQEESIAIDNKPPVNAKNLNVFIVYALISKTASEKQGHKTAMMIIEKYD